jgi:hypothetical protein
VPRAERTAPGAARLPAVVDNGRVDAADPTETTAVPTPDDETSSGTAPVVAVPAAPSASGPPVVVEDPALIAAQREERAARRLRQTVRDMVLSMLAVFAVVLVIWLPSRLHSAPDVRTVDPAPVVSGARQAESWPVLAPVGLPSGWRATSARIDTAADGADVVHLGYLTPTDTYAGIEQSATKAVSFVRDATIRGREAGTSQVGGVTWTRYESDDGHRSLVRTADGATYVVVGTGDWPQVEFFASTLRPR